MTEQKPAGLPDGAEGGPLPDFALIPMEVWPGAIGTDGRLFPVIRIEGKRMRVEGDASIALVFPGVEALDGFIEALEGLRYLSGPSGPVPWVQNGDRTTDVAKLSAP